MALLIKCECGFVARAKTEEAVIAKTREHIRKDHPDQVGKVRREDLLAWIERE
jgi:predicted small metal-binding protein